MACTWRNMLTETFKRMTTQLFNHSHIPSRLWDGEKTLCCGPSEVMKYLAYRNNKKKWSQPPGDIHGKDRSTASFRLERQDTVSWQRHLQLCDRASRWCIELICYLAHNDSAGPIFMLMNRCNALGGTSRGRRCWCSCNVNPATNWTDDVAQRDFKRKKWGHRHMAFAQETRVYIISWFYPSLHLKLTT